MTFEDRATLLYNRLWLRHLHICFGIKCRLVNTQSLFIILGRLRILRIEEGFEIELCNDNKKIPIIFRK